MPPKSAPKPSAPRPSAPRPSAPKPSAPFIPRPPPPKIIPQVDDQKRKKEQAAAEEMRKKQEQAALEQQKVLNNLDIINTNDALRNIHQQSRLPAVDEKKVSFGNVKYCYYYVPGTRKSKKNRRSNESTYSY